MKIVDTFMFCNEYDLLELRLSEHYDKVDKFIIIECDRTFTGLFKGFNLEKQLSRYTTWWDKVEYIKVTNCPSTPNAWVNETWQRSHMNAAWKDLGKDDVILISDLDEIFRPEAIDFIRNTDYDLYFLYMPGFYLKLNYMDTEGHYSMWGRAIRGYQIDGEQMRYIKDFPGARKVSVHHAGWHFGWLGDVAWIQNKIKSFAHAAELMSIVDTIDIDVHIQNHEDPQRRSKSWFPVKFDGYFPKTILNNLEKYRNWILPNADKTVQDYHTRAILDLD